LSRETKLADLKEEQSSSKRQRGSYSGHFFIQVFSQRNQTISESALLLTYLLTKTKSTTF